MTSALIMVPMTVAINAQVIILIVKSVLIFFLETPMVLIVSMSVECCFTNNVMAEIAVPLANNRTTMDRMISVSLLMP